MLLTIFPELQVEVARFLTDPSDCAALCLAVPRGLGLAALRHRKLPQYKDILVSVAMRLATGELQIDEALLRRYLWDHRRMTPEGCEWLTAAAQRAGSPLGIVRSVNQGVERWHLTVGGAGPGALVRKKQPNGLVVLFQGERDAERCVRKVWPNGIVAFCEGEMGAERYVRLEGPDGTVVFYEGERDAERRVRRTWPDGRVIFFEGEKGVERKVREERPCGYVAFFEGERDAERMVRAVLPGGTVGFYEGEREVERRVRMERSDGTASFYEGARGAERLVRGEFPDGRVFYYEGEKGAERGVRLKRSDGTIAFMESVMGAERTVREELPDARPPPHLEQALTAYRALPDADVTVQVRGDGEARTLDFVKRFAASTYRSRVPSSSPCCIMVAGVPMPSLTAVPWGFLSTWLLL